MNTHHLNPNKDRVIVITGATGGFGQALVETLAPQGAKLALTGRSPERLEPLAAKARALGAADVLVHAADITEETAVADFFGKTKAAFGHADVLLNLPGLSIAAPVSEMPVESYDRIIDANLKGPFLAAKHFIPLAAPERSPLIALISSQAATRPNPNAPLYCAAKAAVSVFGQGLALQVIKQNIRVTSIKPGPVDTDGFWGNRPVPREKFMKAAEVAGIIDFVLKLPPHIVMHEVSFESFEFLKK